MEKIFFTSKEAAQITGCTLRQLQYWREKEVVLPVVDATGTGRSVYYSQTDLVELVAIKYWLSIGLSFDLARETLKTLKDQEPNFSNPSQARRFMLWRDSAERSLELVDFDLERAIASLREGQPTIPVWLDAFHQRLGTRLKETGYRR